MESELRLILLLIGLVIIFAIWWTGTRRYPKAKKIIKKKSQSKSSALNDQPLEKIFKLEGVKAALSELEDIKFDSGRSAAEEVMARPRPIDISKAQQSQEASTILAESGADDEMPDLDDEMEKKLEEEVMEAFFESEDEVDEEVEEITEEEVVEFQEKSLEETITEEQGDEEIVAQDTALTETITPIKKPNQLVMFSLIARGDKNFGGFKLLQMLLNNGLHFGDRHIFSYHENNEEKGKKLFSLAAATETGEFDLVKMAQFSCKGLVLFMNAQEHEDPAAIFDIMVEVTERLGKALQADLKIGQDGAWTEENLSKIYEGLIRT